MNSLIDPDEVMAPFAREVFSRLAAEDRPVMVPLTFYQQVSTNDFEVVHSMIVDMVRDGGERFGTVLAAIRRAG